MIASAQMQRAPSLLAVTLALSLMAGACSDTATTTTLPASTTVGSSVAPPTTTGVASTSSTPPTTAASSTTTVAVEDGSLVGRPAIDPTTCDFGAPPEAGVAEITFVRDGFLLAADRNGAVRCIAPFENQQRLVWGPAGDRLLLDTTRVALDSVFAGIVGDGAHFTRPTGRNLIWVEDGRLWKSAVDGTSLRDITFLPEHFAVAYHPAGVEIATVGVDEQGRYGVWVARNDGLDPQRVVTAEEAVITDVAFSQSSGFFLSFAATHEDGTSHVHELTLVDADGLAVRNEFDTSIALESTRPLGGIVANPWSDEIAFTEGTCSDAEGPRARLPWGAEIGGPLDEIPTEVIGWLPGSELLIAAYPEGCDGPAELWVAGTFDGQPTFDRPELLARDVGPAAVRVLYPDPPLPLGEIDLDDFA